jgi:hypothetical protein
LTKLKKGKLEQKQFLLKLLFVFGYLNIWQP